jgi:predicted Zn-dependent protease with MMP-like domain
MRAQVPHPARQRARGRVQIRTLRRACDTRHAIDSGPAGGDHRNVALDDPALDDPATFDRLVGEALDDIPEEFARRLGNVAVIVEDEPSSALLRRMGLRPGRDELYGLYEGVPLPARPWDYAGRLPDRITLFRGPLLRAAPTPERLRREIARTVVHEVAHFFGMDDRAIRRLGY